jgi:hypothetical protein
LSREKKRLIRPEFELPDRRDKKRPKPKQQPPGRNAGKQFCLCRQQQINICAFILQKLAPDQKQNNAQILPHRRCRNKNQTRVKRIQKTASH